MRTKGWLALGVLLAIVPAAAADLSGSFSTTFTLGNASFTAWNTLDLRLSFSGLQIQSLSTWQGLNLAEQTFAVSGSLGNLDIQAGVVLKPISAPRLGTWSTQDFKVVGSFVSLELSLGNLRLRLTLQAG